MKKILTILAAVLVMCSPAAAQTAKEVIKDKKVEARYSKNELNKKVSNIAKKEARKLKRAGWTVAPGVLPLEKQLDRSYLMQYEYEQSGLPKYIFGQASSVGSSYDAAKMQATNNAKLELAGYVESEVTALTESTLANTQLTPREAESINEAVQASKSLIANKLGRVLPVTECYRSINKNTVEVQVRIAYNTKLAMQATKEIVKEKLAAKGEDLHQQLDQIWADFK